MKNAQISKNLLSSIVVFFIALPLCMGIAMASGAPASRGLLTGIIGGIVAGAFAGCRLQVSGPAAGLTVVVLELIHSHGLQALGVVVVAAGLLQLLAGCLRIGRLFQAVSPAVVHGMLAGIGAIILVSQLYIMFDLKNKGAAWSNIVSFPELVSTICSADGMQYRQAGMFGALTIGIMLVWRRCKLDKLTRVPEALPAILITTALSVLLGASVNRVDVPDTVSDLVSPVSLSAFGSLASWSMIQAVLTLAFVASAESMLSAASVDQLHAGVRTDYNKELRAQGLGNMVSGLLGGLPMTGVIVRSKVNIEAGATNQLSAVLHGCWLLLAVALLPSVLELIPTCSLAALLVLTGWKLMDWKVLSSLRKFGWMEVLIFLTTIALMIVADLLTGVLAGLALASVRVGFRLATSMELDVCQTGDTYRVAIGGNATFLMKWKLAGALEKIPASANVEIDFSRVAYLDHACLELLELWETRHIKSGGTVHFDREGLVSRATGLKTVRSTVQSGAGA